jgi:hypothetical protein
MLMNRGMFQKPYHEKSRPVLMTADKESQLARGPTDREILFQEGLQREAEGEG